MSVIRDLERRISAGPIHMTLIDPVEASFEVARKMAVASGKAGTTAIMVGGSTGLTREMLDETIRGIREGFDGPIILFPPSADALSPLADAVYFMSLLNSRDPRFIVGEQRRGAPIIREMGLEPIPMGYVIVEPGMAVGHVGKADVVKRDDVDMAVSYALCAQYWGMKFLYLEAGSGAPEPVPAEMVSAVRKETEIHLIVGGGIRTPESASALARAGADVIVTGTLVEEHEDPETILREIVSSLRRR